MGPGVARHSVEVSLEALKVNQRDGRFQPIKTAGPRSIDGGARRCDSHIWRAARSA
jgi:hypothetical protein